MTTTVPEGVAHIAASAVPGVAANERPKTSEVLLEGQIRAHAARHATRPDHAAMLRRVRAQ